MARWVPKRLTRPASGNAGTVERLLVHEPAGGSNGEAAPRGSRFARARRRLQSLDTVAAADLFERCARFLVVAIVFLVPVVFDPRTLDAFDLVKITTMWVVGMVALSFWLLSCLLVRKERIVHRSRIVRISLLLLAVTLLATLFSSNRGLSWLGLYHRYNGFVSIALYVGALTFIVALFGRRPDATREIALAVGYAAAAVAAYSALQHFGGDPIPWRLGGQIPPFPLGSLGNSEFTASFLGIAAPVVAYLAVSARSLRRRFAWVAVGALIVFAFWVHQSRSGVLAAMGGAVAVAVFASATKPILKIAFVGTMLLFLSLGTAVIGHRADRTVTGVTRTASIQYRGEMWTDALRQVRARPVLGWGPDTYSETYARFRSPVDARSQYLTIPEAPHSIFMSWASSTGVAGVLTYLFLLVVVLLAAARRAPMIDRSRRLLVAGMSGGLVAYLVQGVFSIDVPPLAVLGWLFIAAVAALVDTPQPVQPNVSASRPLSIVRLVAAVGVAALLAFLVVAGFGPYRADHLVWKGERSPSVWSSDTLEFYAKAIRLNPHEAAYRAMNAAYLERIAADPNSALTPVEALEQAAGLYEEAAAMQPGNEIYLVAVARMHVRLGVSGDLREFSIGEDWLRRAVSLDPLDPKLRDYYLDVYNAWLSKEPDPGVRAELMRRRAEEQDAARELRRGPTVNAQ